LDIGHLDDILVGFFFFWCEREGGAPSHERQSRFVEVTSTRVGRKKYSGGKERVRVHSVIGLLYLKPHSAPFEEKEHRGMDEILRKRVKVIDVILFLCWCAGVPGRAWGETWAERAPTVWFFLPCKVAGGLLCV
jgi:hypothetical protein